MAARRPRMTGRRHPWAETLSRGRSLIRHPVSVTRHRLGTALLLLVTAGFALYFYFTRDESIRRRTIAYLTEATGGEVSVGRAEFRMFGGIELDDVHVSTPFDKDLDPSAVDPDDVEMLEDLVTVAIQDAMNRATTLAEEKMGALTGGMRIPGLM